MNTSLIRTVSVMLVWLVFAAGLVYADLQSATSAYRKGDYSAAFEEFLVLAASGDAVAQMNVGVMYHKGQSVRQNILTAARWYRKASEQGLPDAHFALGKLYLDCDVHCETDNSCTSGKCDNFTYSQALELYRKAATVGHARSMFALAEAYQYGFGAPQDGAKAVEWYSRAVEEGLPEAAYRLGQLYEVGKQVPRDLPKAINWFRQAADRGNLAAAMSLTNLYEIGDKVPRDFRKARRWLKRRQELGDCYANQELEWLQEKPLRRINRPETKNAKKGDIVCGIPFCRQLRNGLWVIMDAKNDSCDTETSPPHSVSAVKSSGSSANGAQSAYSGPEVHTAFGEELRPVSTWFECGNPSSIEPCILEKGEPVHYRISYRMDCEPTP